MKIRKNIGLTFDDVLLVPKYSNIMSRANVSTRTNLTNKISLEIPIISSNMDTVTEDQMAIAMAKLGGIGIIHRFLSVEDQVSMITRVKKAGDYLVGAAVGVKIEEILRIEGCLNAGADVLVVDIAHGDSFMATSMTRYIKKYFPSAQVISGNVATAFGTRNLIEAGADAVKVGIGAGSICTTRAVTGFGVPQLSAIIECAKEARKHNIPIIADGGISTSGDIVKALAGGAFSVMIGSMLAGTTESPGEYFYEASEKPLTRGKKYKIVRGMASKSASIRRKLLDNGNASEDMFDNIIAEGVEAYVYDKGNVSNIINTLVGGIRSGLSYAGVSSIPDLYSKAEFVQITQASKIESDVHGVIKIGT
jgi:IMP dehydrogenase/GMP reductase